ncbi:MAG: sensor histidine kinase, partial [Verrucomicrobiales bacterium]
MKSSYLPVLTLAALLAAALATLVAGVRMAREQRVVRTEVGREEVGDLSAAVMEQLARLDRLYEGHLRKLASLELGDRFALRNACDGIVGIRQLAFAVDTVAGGRSEPFQLNFEAGYRGVPMLPGQPEPALDGDFYYLPEDELAAGPDHGWLKTPGQPIMFWERRSAGEYVVVTPDPAAVREAVNGWLEDWLPEVVEPVGATGARVRLAGALGDVWEAGGIGGADSTPPDVVVPMRARFGEWRISSWDERVPAVSYHVPTLVISVGLAAVFAMFGAAAFLLLRRALRLGEQRVSFVNRVSHELRTPLTNILLNNDLAADAIELGDEAAATGRLDLIREEAGRLSRLIANVLTFSRSGDETAPVTREVFSLAACVERTLAPFRASLVRRGIALRVEVDSDLY